MNRRDFLKNFTAAGLACTQASYLLSRRPPPGEEEIRRTVAWMQAEIEARLLMPPRFATAEECTRIIMEQVGEWKRMGLIVPPIDHDVQVVPNAYDARLIDISWVV